MKRKDSAGDASDYQHFSGHLKRYAAARKEARLLRFGETQGLGEGPESEAGVHPWLQASRRAKAASGSPAAGNDRGSGVGDARREGQTGWADRAAALGLVAGVAVVLGLAVALFQTARPPLPAGPAAPLRIEVWHALAEGERGELDELAALLSSDEVRFEPVFRPDLPDALRQGVLLGQLPALAIVELETAESLARAGALVPLSGAGDLFVPLADPLPWTRPLIAVAFRSSAQGAAGEPADELTRQFAQTLAAMRAPGG